MDKIKLIKEEISKVVVGHTTLIDAMLIALLTESHLLVEGVPGLAKTTAVNALAKVLGLDFKRVQFTPDLLPSDITGVEIYDPKSSEFKIKKGPIFTNLLLADEINRAPAKVQSALLEVMQEKQVTIGDETFKLEPPFLVMATQNPVEQEGTYPLPEAQLDRFMLKVLVSYNTPEEEFEIVKRVEKFEEIELKRVITKDELIALKKEVKAVNMDDALLKYIIDIVTATREPEKFGLNDLKEYIDFGASPRASINLYKASKALAFIRGKDYVTPVDVAKIAPDILRHRILLNYKAVANNIDSDLIIKRVLKEIPSP
jgi:MoxR-like ATPase